jgi:hypothetical protein
MLGFLDAPDPSRAIQAWQAAKVDRYGAFAVFSYEKIISLLV